MLRLCLTSLLALMLPAAYAAEPASGTISDDSPSAEWTGGPFVVPNVTPLLGVAEQDPVCEEGTPTCDVYRFEVNLSNADQDNDFITVTVVWADSIPDDPLHEQVGNFPDYDLYLFDDETGDLVVDQASGANPEVITLPPANRKYRLVIIPFMAANEPYTGKVELKSFEDDKSGSGALVGAMDGGLLALLAAAGLLARRRRR